MFGVNMKKLYAILAMGAIITTAVIFVTTNDQGHVGQTIIAPSQQVETSNKYNGVRGISQLTEDGNEQSILSDGRGVESSPSGRTDVIYATLQNLSHAYTNSDRSTSHLNNQQSQQANSLKLDVLSILRNGVDIFRKSDPQKQLQELSGDGMMAPSKDELVSGRINAPPVGDLMRNITVQPVSGDLLRVPTQSCVAPKKNLLFLKTHKTGSSTIQNIVYRYGDKNSLTFALPVVDVYMGTPSLFQEKYAVKSPTGKFNMLANHARYNRPTMQNIMYKDAAYITIIRHPSTQFESFYAFYGFKQSFGVDLPTFIKEPMRYYSRQGAHPMHNALNPTLYDLGMSKTTLADENAIHAKIADINSEFDLVLVSEYILESLVLLKDLMCWEFSDVTYFSANARSKSKTKSDHAVSDRTFEQTAKWNHGDMLLYEHFNRTLWAKVDAYGRERMSQDVRTLQKMNEALAEKCLGGTTQVKNVKSVVDHYVLKKSAESDAQCVRMIRPAIQYLGVLKKRQADKWRHR